MAKLPPYPPKSSGRTMAGPSKKKLGHPSFAGSDTEPYNVRPQKPKRQMPKRKQGSMDNDLRQMGPRKPPTKTMPKRIGGAIIEKPAKRPKPIVTWHGRAVIQKPFKRQKPASKRIGKAVVPKAKKMGY